MASSTLRRRLERLEAELAGPSNVTLEELVLWSMRIGETLSEADQRLYDDFSRRSATSPLCRCAHEAAVAGETYRAADVRDAVPEPAVRLELSDLQTPDKKAPSLVEQMAQELGVPAAEVMQALRGLDQPEGRPCPTSAPATEEQRSAAPQPTPPVHEIGRDRFYQRGEVFDSGYADSDLVPAQPGMSLSALMAQHRSRKDR
jgi:hypothetical protein